MATIEVPDALIEPWKSLDEAFQLLQMSARIGGVSRASIATIFAAVIGKAPWENPSFALWAYIRHGAGSYGDFMQILVGTRTDSSPHRPRPFLKTEEDLEDEAINAFADMITDDPN